jgi:gamma-tubulin complex component 4
VLDLLEINFSEQEQHKIRVVYNRTSLAVYLWRGENSGAALIDLKLNLDKLLQFDMGKAFLGFLADGFNSSFNADLLNWTMKGYNVFNSEDPWNGLTIKYTCNWPMNLVLSDQVLERYSNLFRLLFPIKNIQVQLHKTWCVLNSQMRRNPEERLFIYVSSLRNKMSFFIDNIWSYFHLDVLEVQWMKLTRSLKELNEFEDLRLNIKTYLESIYIQTFLNFPQIVRSLFKIVGYSKEFCVLISKMEVGGELIYDIETDILVLQQRFDQHVSKFIRLINHLNQAGSTHYLSQLLTRLNFNGYYQSVNNEMELEGY